MGRPQPHFAVFGLALVAVAATFSGCGDKVVRVSSAGMGGYEPNRVIDPEPEPDSDIDRGWRGPYTVSSDPGARFWIIEVRKNDAGLVIFDSMRRGRSGDSFSTRVVDCKRMTFTYLREGDTLKDLLATEYERASVDDMKSLTAGSISSSISLKACGQSFL